MEDELDGDVAITYDWSLPRQHAYLGTDLEELSGRTVLDEEEYLELPLLSFMGVVLIPGQILPLKIGHPSRVAMLKDIISKNRTFGIVVKVSNNNNPRSQSLASVGTTAEICSYKEENDPDTNISFLSIKAEGRQRFSLEEIPRRRIDGILIGKVKILPEIILDDPGIGVRPKCFQKFQLLPPHLANRVKDINLQGSNKKYRKYRFCDYMTLPSWVYEQYDPHILMGKIKKELLSWNSVVYIKSMPEDPLQFSYWVVSNLPLDDSLKVVLLTRNSMIQRLRCAMSILETYQMLFCKECGSSIAEKQDLFSLSTGGVQGTYVNPGGYIHETITVLRAKNVHDVTLPSTEHSWFPGYSWTIVNCEECRSHMGWKFETTDENIKPQVFWGLCRRGLLPGIFSEQDKWEPCW